MSSFVRDPVTSAVINTDDARYRAILAERQMRKQAADVQSQLDALNNDITEIKNLLVQVLKREQ